MKEFKIHNSFDNRNINILDIKFENDEKKDNDFINSKSKNSFDSKNKPNSSKENTTTNRKTILNDNSKIVITNNKEGKTNIKNELILNKIQNNPIKQNRFPSSEIKKSDLEFNKSEYRDKSCQNWEEVRNNVLQHIENEKFFKKLEKINMNKKFFNDKRKYFFGRHKIDNLPYIYDISSTYMNNYYNKSEHKRHEIIIDELCKLRSYLIKYPNNNNLEIIKDFLFKHNIQNLGKYSNFQLLQLGKFVCQDDIYKINSLLKPYLHVKDMIYDILNNSIDLNNKFSGYKFNSSIDKLLKKIREKNKENYKNDKNSFFNNKILDKINENKNRNQNFRNLKNNSESFDKKLKKIYNKKFYISELDYSINSNSNDHSKTIEKNDKRNNENKDEEKNGKIRDNNHKEFLLYSKKRKEILNSIGITVKKKLQTNDMIDTYSSPLFKKNLKKADIYNIKRYRMKNKNAQFPKIKNEKIEPYYKPNKLLLAQDKNYSSNFNILCKDITKELKDFEKLYQQKFDIILKRNLSQNNYINLDSQIKNNRATNRPLIHSQSCNLFDSKDLEKKMEDASRLYYGKKTLKVELNDIQKKHKLTEYIALANAKTHVKNDIINDNVLK